MNQNAIIFLILFPAYLQALQIPTGQSNAYFDVQLDRVEQLFIDKNYSDWSGVKVKKVNKTRSIVGEVIFYETIGNEVLLEGNAYKKQGGDYKQMPYKSPRTPLCKFFQDDIYVYPKLAEKSDFPADIKANCPLKEGSYKINGFFLDFAKLPKVIAPSGDYAAELTGFKDGNMVFKARIYETIVNI